ncbi:hypothetical protein [Sciscionella marina]|uniref:hypothetical protein n=1 Tax=Sciscionella marina TaxID=508770 RepID=UPI000370E03F|nr:hypothetical protein [Sciscionella marina]
MSEDNAAAPRESMRDAKALLNDAAAGMRGALDDAPTPLPPDATGDPALTKQLNDVMETLFKASAQLMGDAQTTADKIDPDAGTFDGIPVEGKSNGDATN